MTQPQKELLKSVDFFSSLSDDDLTALATLCDVMKLSDGQVIFQTGDSSDQLYIVEDGEVVIRKSDSEGHVTDIARYLPGTGFGELDMFVGNMRNADALAVGNGKLLAFPSQNRRIEDISATHPALSSRLLRAFLVQISARIRRANALVKENSPLVQELRRQVYVDKLTELNNKTCFEEALTRLLGSGTPLGLLLYKPDNFKQINDTCGHEVGDRVLKYIAKKLLDFTPDRDMLFRYMGNENAIIFPDISREALTAQARRLGDYLRGMELDSILKSASLHLSVSLGLALAPEHGYDAASLIDAAHSMVLEGRRRGGNQCLFPEEKEVGKHHEH